MGYASSQYAVRAMESASGPAVVDPADSCEQLIVEYLWMPLTSVSHDSFLRPSGCRRRAPRRRRTRPPMPPPEGRFTPTAIAGAPAADPRNDGSRSHILKRGSALLFAKGAHLGAVDGGLCPAALLSREWRSRCLLDSGKRRSGRSTKAMTRAPAPASSDCHGFSCLAAAGERLLRPGDAQARSAVPAATAALLLLYGIGRSLAPRSDGPGSTVRVIAMGEEQ
jgi:hypothetical protein